ncbi:hypothetical protein FS749_014809, partial [Ceratobasidium sp. UAMH 11750]
MPGPAAFRFKEIIQVRTHSAQLQEWADKQHVLLTWDCTTSRLLDGRPVNKVTPI